METTVAASAGAGEDGLSLGLVPQKLARTETYPFRMMNPFPTTTSSSHVDPTFWDSSSKPCDFYDVAAATSLQPFPVSHLRNPGGGGMVASPRYPFTWEQWKMLERQALIYKHMVASVPVPTELLIPIISGSSRTTLAGVPASHLGRCSSFNLRFSNGTDPEPGRCRRTDGKKWRCSRDAAPDQKYCERHMHRGRPRSRKPVEVPAQDVTTPTAANPNAALSKAFHRTPGLPSQALLPKEQRPRCLDPTSAPITGSSNGSSNSLFLHPYEDNLSLNFVDFKNGVSKTDQENDQSGLYLKYDFADPETEQRPPARRFIDTWSSTTSAENQTTISANNNEPSMSSLTLSIPGEKTNETQVGADSSDSKRDSSWINLTPWLSSPLGEVLQQSGSNSASSPSRLESSPSCVLQKAFASLSDSSGSSSPTFAAAAAAVPKSEIALQWLMP